MNDILNVIMTLQLPFAVIPLVAFTSNAKIMGEFVNGIVIKLVSILLFIIILTINIIFVANRLNDVELHSGWLTAASEYKNDILTMVMIELFVIQILNIDYFF